MLCVRWKAARRSCPTIWPKMIMLRKLSTVSFRYFKTLDIWKACKDGDLDKVRIMIREGQNVNE